MTSIHDLPIEIVIQILLDIDPLGVSRFSRTCRAYRSLVYDPPNANYFWRRLYFRQDLDDPRICYNELGNLIYDPSDGAPVEINWMERLQKFIRARTVVTIPEFCRHERGEREEIYRNLVDAVKELPPLDDDEDSQSLTAAYVASLLVRSRFLDTEFWEDALPLATRQLRAQLHTYFGISKYDLNPGVLSAARGAIYALRNWKPSNFYGPYHLDGSGTVDWEMMRKIHLVMSMNILPDDALERVKDDKYLVYHMSLVFCQAWIPKGVVLDKVEDWAGVTGTWFCSFCFIDHRVLLGEWFSST